MSEAYSALAEAYDALMRDVPYGDFARQIERLFRYAERPPRLVLDLACGTGTLTRLMAERGYEMIGADLSPEMLDVARAKCAPLSCPPVFICQGMAELDLYGTVEAAYCCLDSVNYVTDVRELRRVFARVALFLEPGGVFVFDIKTRAMFAAMNGVTSAAEADACFSVWQYGFDGKSNLGVHVVELFFEQPGGAYTRVTEEHVQRAYTLETLRDALSRAGLTLCGVFDGTTARRVKSEEGRLFLVAKKPFEKDV